ncbi:MAG: hypothetical protein LC107_05635 [Chitinophagales bacterium]|nr:hypothetical protein [Chitinophagales bacterium]
MKIPISIAEKLILLCKVEKIPASKIRHSVINEMLDNGILKKQIQGRSKAYIYCTESRAVTDFLKNHYGISDLQNYIDTLQDTEITRSDLITVSSDSKQKSVRTFKGFLVNCYTPIPATLNENQIVLNPVDGTFQFIYDFENFILPDDITIVGIENPENFRYIEKQKYLFENIKPLFVSRYPQNQSKDLLKWLQSIPNNYLHFGDFDFAGIGIYLNEYKKHLDDKAQFFIPENIEFLLGNYGSRALYDKQKLNFEQQAIEEENLTNLIALLHQYKKGLEQEIFINSKVFTGINSKNI